ncbi:alpha/beta hydrolase [Photobacterium angustum]|uniref:Hydrolase, alpha/beta fold family protein n=1 Tax=Photobacterium angustum (strain S14 / CCUG 15956) TaxID=314292 RepID=Q1ZVK5_PHOAS|nr:hypothetical protein [Photobacterium angustum]EAS66055.1 hydrolase, alpha/beta fold family protein [Photobacterium angustum S14]
MTSYKKLILASSLILLAGCNSGSGSQTSTTEHSKTPTTEHSKTPTTEHSKTPTTEHSKTPTTEHSKTPTTEHSKTPTTEHSKTPTTEHSKTPTTEHSKTPTTEHSKTPTTKKVTKPVADYNFTDEELRKLARERIEVLKSVKLTYDGQVYSQMLFGEGLDDNRAIIRLMNENNDTVDLMIDRNEKAECIIYNDNTKNKVKFDCGKDKQSVGNETTLIMAKLATLEYNNDDFEYLSHIGSTVLTAINEGDGVDIETSAAFKDFLHDIFGKDVSEYDQNSSTLGVSTLLQLGSIVHTYEGREMMLKFDNIINGSVDDDVNMYTGLMIRNNEINTMITKNGSVFSGGTDLFSAGVVRILERKAPIDVIELNKQVGVHSWSDGKKTAKEIPYSDVSHRKQATYFKTMLGDKGVDFYMYMLDSAPASGEHWVTMKESKKYNLISGILD